MSEVDAGRVRSRRSQVMLSVAVMVLLVMGASVGWFLADTFQSPAQREASARPPVAGAITAEVKRGDLSRSFSIDVTVGRAMSQLVALSGESSPSVITARAVAPGQGYVVGDVLTEINGSPVFVMTGAFPFYRDLTVGDTGPDVRQLQSSLVAQGARVSIDGTFGAETESALGALYVRHGYSAPVVAADEVTGDEAPSIEATAQAPTAPPLALMRRESFLVVHSSPVQIVEGLAVGQILSETSLTFDSGVAVARAPAPSESIVGVLPGQRATITLTDGRTVASTVLSVAEPTAEGVQVIAFAAAGPAFPEDAVGFKGVSVVQLDLIAEDALIVPTAAVVTSGGNDAFVLVERPDRSFYRVEVDEVATLNGESAVAAKTTTDLAPGDRVKVA